MVAQVLLLASLVLLLHMPVEAEARLMEIVQSLVLLALEEEALAKQRQLEMAMLVLALQILVAVVVDIPVNKRHLLLAHQVMVVLGL
jgi:hypothetical protein